MNLPALRSSRTAYFALWLMLVTLLLKAAMPMLATASAQIQGKALVEVCSVYGVKTIALDGTQAPGSEGHAGVASEHCALAGMATLVLPQLLAPMALPALRGGGDEPGLMVAPDWRDANALWVALLKHGPPSRS